MVSPPIIIPEGDLLHTTGFNIYIDFRFLVTHIKN
jgi:hypothetical protein